MGMLGFRLRWWLSELLSPLAHWDLWQSLDRIAELSAGRQLPALAAAVRADPRQLAPAGRLGLLQLRLAWPLLMLRHPAAQRNPCLYHVMLSLAHESAAGRPAEVNVLLSDGPHGFANGHCWLTREGRLLYGPKGPDFEDESVCMGRREGVVYWWRKADAAPDSAHGEDLPLAPGGNSWPI
jgi:hypothetical protein